MPRGRPAIHGERLIPHGSFSFTPDMLSHLQGEAALKGCSVAAYLRGLVMVDMVRKQRAPTIRRKLKKLSELRRVPR